jgi:iron complex outermembrane receptor protein
MFAGRPWQHRHRSIHGINWGFFMKVNKVHAAVVAALTGAGGLSYQTAFAQEGLEEIVVTATRREENLQEVPISIIAITGDNLEMRGLDNLEELSHGVPNVIITGGGGGTGGANFRMRGIPNVGTYIDGVWQVGTSGFLTQEFVDIDRVEVLRGPQGTMFGRDSTGGALRIWTKRPAEEFGGTVTAATGSYDRRDVKASLDLPLGDTIQTKWTGASLNRDGYITSLTTGEDHGGIDQEVFRGDIVWTPTDRLDFRLNYQNDTNTFTEPRLQDAMFRTYDDPAPGWGKSVIGLPEMYTYVGVDYRNQPVEPFFDPVNQVAGYPGGRVGEYQNRSNSVLPNQYETQQTSLETNWDISDTMSLQFLTAVTEQDADSVVDWDNSQYDLVLDMNRSTLDVFSQEIQLTGGGDRIEWLAGAYYWDQKQINRNGRWQVNEFQLGLMDPTRVFNNPSAPCNVAPLQLTPSTTDHPNNMRFVPGSVGADGINYGGDANAVGAWQSCQQVYYSAIPGSFDVFSIAEQDGWAVFGEVTVHFGDDWDLTIGARQHDQSGYSQNLAQIPGVTAVKPVEPTQFHVGDPFIGTKTGIPNAFAFDKMTPRAVLQKRFGDNVMGYVSYAEGFNSGGISAPVINGVRTEFAFKPSTLENFEIGVRSDLFDGRLRLNVTVFDTTWADLQAAGVVRDPVTGVQIPTLVTTNVGEAEAQGAEFEVTWLPTESLMLNLGYGVLSTGYTEIAPGTMNGHLPFTTDMEFQQAPDDSYTIGLQHMANLGSGGTFTSRADYNFQGQFWRSEPFLRVTGYEAIPDTYEESGDWGIFNLRFTYEPAEGNWQASFFGTNLTDEYTINSGFFHGIWGFDFATLGRPREAGASLMFRF